MFDLLDGFVIITVVSSIFTGRFHDRHTRGVMFHDGRENARLDGEPFAAVVFCDRNKVTAQENIADAFNAKKAAGQR